MADYFTKASFIVPLTDSQSDFAIKVVTCFEDESIDLTKRYKTKAAKIYDLDVYRMAKKLVRRLDCYCPSYPSIDFECQKEEKGLCICYAETINTGNAAIFTQLLLKHFDIKGFVAFEAAHTCSAPRLSGFGGHACFITQTTIKWHSTCTWIHQQIKRSKVAVAEQQH